MKISVVIPLYNKKEAVLRAVNSVLAQTSPPEEIIVVNDGSTDGSEKIITELNHPLIRLINQTNAGVSAARNKGISEAKNDWIAFLDADDEWLPQYLRTINHLHSGYSDAKVLATAYYLHDQERAGRKVILNRLHFTEVGILDNYFEVAAFSEPPIHSSSVVVNKQAMSGIGGFPEGIASGEDLLTWARLAVNNKIAYSAKPMSCFIKEINTTARLPQVPDSVGMALYQLVKTTPVPYMRRYISVWHKMRCRDYLSLGKKYCAFTEACRSIRFFPLTRAWLFLPFIVMPSELFYKINLISRKD